jgi:hypothetical protein
MEEYDVELDFTRQEAMDTSDCLLHTAPLLYLGAGFMAGTVKR